MSKTTISEKLAIVAVKAYEFKEVESRSKKYREFRSNEPEQTFFIGKNGAMRVGRISSESVPVLGKRKKMWLRRYDTMVSEGKV